jgi:hypothetical protein
MTKVSVIITTYNDEYKDIDNSIRSIQKQSVDHEIIISFPSNDVNAHLYRQDSRIRANEVDASKHPGRSPEGSFFQLNDAMKMITGTHFLFFSNDIMYGGKLELETSYEGKIVITGFDYANERMQVTGSFTPKEYSYNEHLTGNIIPDCTTIPMWIMEKYGPFRSELYGNYAYWDFWLRVYEGEGNIFINDTFTTWLYIQRQSSMHVKRSKDAAEQKRCDVLRRKMLKDHGA